MEDSGGSSKKRHLQIEDEKPTNSLVKLLKRNKQAEMTQMIRIGVDGYYGNDPFMTMQLMDRAKRKVIEVITQTFKINDFSRIVWVCPLGSWMKCLPVMLIGEGLGHHIEFVAPCGKVVATNEGLIVTSKNGFTVTRSIELMDERLKENTNHRLCQPPSTLSVISNMVQDKRAFMLETETWNEQSEKVIGLCDYAIVLPYHDTCTIMTEEQKNAFFKNYGGRLYNSKPSNQKVMINLYDLVRESVLQLNPNDNVDVTSCIPKE